EVRGGRAGLGPALADEHEHAGHEGDGREATERSGADHEATVAPTPSDLNEAAAPRRRAGARPLALPRRLRRRLALRRRGRARGGRLVDRLLARGPGVLVLGVEAHVAGVLLEDVDLALGLLLVVVGGAGRRLQDRLE